MKIFRYIHLSFRPVAARLLVTVLAAAWLAGCATTHQVKSIVAESNAALLAAELPEISFGGDPAASVALANPAAISQKIDDFIAAHPDQRVAASALRIRQAILLIVHGEYELARAAFADATELKTDRDQALKTLSEPIIWWWQHSQVAFLNEAQLTKSREHLDAFDRELPKLGASPDIRDLLAEMRARIGLKRVTSLQITDGTKKKEAFVDVLNQYGATFTAEDSAAIKRGNLRPQASAISPAEKRRLRALAVIEKAKPIAQSLRTGGQAVAVADLKSEAAGFGGLVLEP